MNTLSELLLDYRKSHAMTQKELANFIDVSEVTISNAENNKIAVGSKTIKSIADKFEIDILEVVRLNENNKQT